MQTKKGCTNARRIGRGKTTGLSIAKKRRKGATGKLHVIIPADKIVAVGPRTVNFMTEISIIVQQHPPFNVQKWKGVHDVVKERIVMKVMDSFVVDGTSTKHTKEVILDTIKRLH
ncbi:hypothetical protein GLYMA_16G084900v4 [Glycine max]|nr:hypothetical protein GYH30_044509 [Glycine max]KRH07385.2 hypothetical protein GLYMA_16G084900v4 [Glycine max]